MHSRLRFYHSAALCMFVVFTVSGVDRVFPKRIMAEAGRVRPNHILADEHAMLALYRILPDVLAQREVKLPLLFPWSHPVFYGSPLGVDTIILSDVSTRTVARSTIASHVAGCSEMLKGSDIEIRFEPS